MQIKPGVQLNGVHYLMWWAAAVYDYVHQAQGFGEATITGGTEPASGRVRATLHTPGMALDFRRWAIPASRMPGFHAALTRYLGPTFEVIVEQDHIHVELAPTTFEGRA